MCGFVGFVNLKEKLNTNSKIILEKMNNTLVFGSEIKALFEYPSIEKILDSQGISELLGIRS